MEILVINLEEDTGRLKNISNQLDQFTRIDAIRGSDITDLQPHSTLFCRLFCTHTMIGCMLSHIKCWRYIVDNNLDRAIILEDDAKLVPDFKTKAQKLVDDAPNDWDVILCGCFLCNEISNDYFSKGNNVTYSTF